MKPPLFNHDKKFFAPFIEKIRTLYSSMDRSCAEAAAHYGFECSGCDDNCCEERFYHYTLTEHVYLMEGVGGLDDETRIEIFSRADEVIQIYRLHDSKGIIKRVMCPLNLDSLCLLYEYRPMICRLHGIPHIIRKPGQPEQQGPGCHKFDEVVMPDKTPSFEFDRTAFYSEMASLEIEIRRMLNFNGRYKKTVAGMIMDISESGKTE